MIVLATESTMLGEVVVKSNRPVTAIKGDALVTNVAGTQRTCRNSRGCSGSSTYRLSGATDHSRFSARAPRQSISTVVLCVIQRTDADKFG